VLITPACGSQHTQRFVHKSTVKKNNVEE